MTCFDIIWLFLSVLGIMLKFNYLNLKILIRKYFIVEIYLYFNFNSLNYFDYKIQAKNKML